jgi:hypothetical protein
MKKIMLACAIAFTASLALGMWYFTSLPTNTTKNNNTSENSSDKNTPPDTGVAGETKTDTKGPHIYVSFASHNEDEFHPDYPNYVDDEETFWQHRNDAIAYARMLHEHGVKYDFQTDWNFLLAVLAYDKGDESTNGKNVIRYLHEDLGVDIDPHSHESSGYNLVDVAYLIKQTGVTPTGVVGGFIAGPPEDSQLSYFWNLSQGEKYPSASWEPQMLWGGGTGQHQNESDYWTSGIWYPKSAENFKTHDPNAPLPVVGNYLSSWEGLDDLLSKLRNGELDENGFYTITIMINQSGMDEATRNDYEEHIISYEDEVTNGEIIYATVSEAFTAWEAIANGEPTILSYDGTSTSTGLGGNSSSGAAIPAQPQGGAAECGDNICTSFERKFNACPADCE